MSPAAKHPRLVLIDAHALIHRAFHAIPFLSTKGGELTNAVYGFTSTVLSVLKELQPEYVAVSFDLPEPTFRHKQYADYKATRQKAPDELRSQFGRVREVVDVLGMPVFEIPGYEADDVIGSLAKKYGSQNGLEVYIVTGDKDSLQLVDEQVKIFTLRKGIKDTVIYDPKLLKEETGLTADEFIEYKALKGDPSDNIPGVPGIGDKTASALAAHYHTLEKLYEALDEDPGKHPLIKPKVRANLAEFKKQAYLSRDLSRIVTDLDLKFDLPKCKLHDFDQAKAETLFKDLEFNSLIPRLRQVLERETATQVPPKPAAKARDWKGKKYQLIATDKDLDTFIGKLGKQKIFAFDTETERLDSISPNLVGVSISWKGHEGYYLACHHQKGPSCDIKSMLAKLKPIFEDPNIKKVGHHLKYDYEALRCNGIETQGLYFDTLLGSYLLNPGGRSLKLDNLAYQELGYDMQPISELIGDGRQQLSMAEVSSEDVAVYAAEDADVTWQLYEKLSQNLRDVGLTKLLDEIELPLVPVLAAMEQRGVLLDTKFLAEMGRRFDKDLGKLERQIYKLCGQEFNLNSPSQLSKVLFEDLQIGKGITRRGGTHKSTAADQLEKYKDKHRVIPHLIRYRELMKLKTTYIEALPKQVRSDTGRLHTSYSQTIAATGRLSSSDPNLQNIPIRTELGRKIRKAFVTEPGFTLISADYSQFELRIAAHISGDKKLSENFREGLDIHAATAATIAGVALEDVKPEQRYAAKAVNFSILYGATPHGLRNTTGMSIKDAEAYIHRYFQTYPKLKDYMEEMIAKAETDGFVETLFGRRRYLPEIKASSYPIREAAKRMAINMPVQGSQADILKIAMINIHAGLPKVSSKARMLLTVHDELVFEASEKDVQKVTKYITDQMEHAYELSVPIIAEAKVGDSWGEMEPVKAPQ